MRAPHALSIIVPTYNEADNVGLLVERIDTTMRAAALPYEIIFIDDKSTDGTRHAIRGLADHYPVRFYFKRGKMGKAFSLLEGFKKAQYDTLCMIDADLQYPPEAIARMYKLFEVSGADIIITNRVAAETSFLRRVMSSTFNFVFIRLLFGFKYDTQSGLKLFSKRVIDSIEITPTPWSFDLEFIVRSLEKGYRILSYDIVFSERHAGEAKINVIANSIELGLASLKVRFNSSARAVRKSVRSSAKLAQGLGIFLFMIGTIFMASPVKADTITVGPIQLTVPLSLQNAPAPRPAQSETPSQTADPQTSTSPEPVQQTPVQPTAAATQTPATTSMQSAPTSSVNTTPAAATASQAVNVLGAAAPSSANSPVYTENDSASTSGLKRFATIAVSAGFIILAVMISVIGYRRLQTKRNQA